MSRARAAATGVVLALLAFPALPVAQGQTTVRLSGLAYLDYSYVLKDPAATAEGDNGFGYRRLYLTSDFTMSERVSVRARLETSDGGLNSANRPSPFVKDLHVRWRNALGEGHELFLGITSPPGWEVSERFFGYRSLEATLMDRQRIAASRDFGVRATGPIGSGGKVRYNVMFGNDSAVNRESDRSKRVYGQFELHPVEHLTVTVGGDYAAREAGAAYTGNAFVGYEFDAVRVGAEGYVSPVRLDAPLNDTDRTGFSLVAVAAVSPKIEALCRFDSYHTRSNGTSTSSWYGLAGVAWMPENGLRIIPNLMLDKESGADAPMITGRVTVHVDF